MSTPTTKTLLTFSFDVMVEHESTAGLASAMKALERETQIDQVGYSSFPGHWYEMKSVKDSCVIVAKEPQ